MKKLVIKMSIIFFISIFIDVQIIAAQNPEPIWYPDWGTAMLKDAPEYPQKYKNHNKIMDICQEIYESGNPNNLDPINSIPKIIHAIWVGPRAIPPLFLRCHSTWLDKFQESGWNIMLWTNEKVESEILPLFSDEHKAIYNNGNRDHREKADVLRLYLLKHFGGIYVDGDITCTNAEAFKGMIQYYDFFIGMSPARQNEIVNNAIIGSTPNHPIINYILGNLKNISTHDWRVRSGVYFFSRQFCNIFPKAPGINIAFPVSTFYAAPGGYNKPASSYLKPWSLVLHYWANYSNHAWK